MTHCLLQPGMEDSLKGAGVPNQKCGDKDGSHLNFVPTRWRINHNYELVLQQVSPSQVTLQSPTFGFSISVPSKIMLSKIIRYSIVLFVAHCSLFYFCAVSGGDMLTRIPRKDNTVIHALHLEEEAGKDLHGFSSVAKLL